MLSESAKSILKYEKRRIAEWEKLSRKEEIEKNWQEFKNWEVPKAMGHDAWCKSQTSIKEEIVSYLKSWAKKNGKEEWEVIIYHPSIEKEIGSEYGKQNLNFEIILVVITIIIHLGKNNF